jgi:hypothetical protein
MAGAMAYSVRIAMKGTGHVLYCVPSSCYPARTGLFSDFHGVTEKHFLFWAVIGGLLVTFPAVYIPVINKVVFKHLGIGWERGVVAARVVVYVAVMESRKALKRRFGIGNGGVIENKTDGEDVEGRSSEGRSCKVLSIAILSMWMPRHTLLGTSL